MSDSIIGSLSVLADRYEIGDLIGRGGMAEVYVGRDIRLDRKVAIKLLKPELAVNEKFRTRFRQEAQSAARMSHPTVVRVFDAGEEITVVDGVERTVPFIIIEYVDGRLLSNIIADGPLPESEAVRITRGILTALEYSHRAGVIHCDIKPGNVMLTPGGQIKVMDFGIARAVSESTTSAGETGTILGTAQYFSPEQARGDVIDGRTDLYSTGLILFELLTGRPPFTAESPVAVAYQHVSEEPPRPSEIVAGISPAMESVVARALAKRPEQRFENARVFAEALEASLEGVVVDAPEAAFEDSYSADEDPGALTTMFAAIEAADDGDVEEIPATESRSAKRPVGLLWGGGIAVVAILTVIVLWLGNFGPNFNLGNLATEVPDLVSQDVDTAEAMLEELGLLKPQIVLVNDDSDPGTVLAQAPEAGTSIGSDTRVRLTVSSGPEPSALANFAGLTVAQATNALEAARLVVADTTEENSANISAGVVIRTEPESGTVLPAGASVTLVVSTGMVSVPNVVGQDYRTATERLQGDTVGYTVRLQSVLSCWGGNVTQQSITPGTHEQRQTITLTYCGGSRPQPSPSPSDDDDDDDDSSERGGGRDRDSEGD